MTQPLRDILLDSKNAFEHVRPYLEGEGGRVCIRGSETAGVLSFMSYLRGILRKRDPNGLCVKIDPESDENTHYAGDIVRTLGRKLGLSGADWSPVNIVSNSHAGGNLTVEHVEINGPMGGGTEEAIEHRTRRVLETIQTQTAQRRVALMLHDCHKAKGATARWVWRRLWDDDGEGLVALREKGLALFCCCELSGACPHEKLVAAADLTLPLPERYSGSDAAEVEEQVAGLIVKHCGATHAEARQQATGVLKFCKYEPTAIYGGLPALLQWGKMQS